MQRSVANRPFAGEAPPADLRPERSEEFDEELDAEGLVEIAGATFRRSDVLHELQPVTYAIAVQEFHERREEDLCDRVLEQFPFPVAQAFHRFHHGAETDLERLTAMRDVWESIVHVLWALALGYARSIGTDIVDSGIKRGQLQSKTIVDRIATVEAIGRTYADSPIDFRRVVADLNELNGARNKRFAHVQQLSSQQARSLVDDLRPSLFKVLRALDDLANVLLFRYRGSEGLRHRLQVFVGHSPSKRIESHSLERDVLVSFANRGNSEEDIYSRIGDVFVPLAPMIVSSNGASDACVPAFLKEVHGVDAERRLTFETFGIAGDWTAASPGLLRDLDAVKELFVATPTKKNSDVSTNRESGESARRVPQRG